MKPAAPASVHRDSGRMVVLLLCTFLIVPMIGCRREKPAPSADEVVQLDSPRAVYDQLRQWHARHSYLSMTRWIHPAVGDQVIELLVAMDELKLADTSAQVAVAKSIPDVDPREFGMSEIFNFLGLFSRDAEFKSEKIDGDKAVVTIQVARRLPLKQVRFRRYEGRWVYSPDPLPDGLTESIRLLAQGMNRFAAVVAAGPCTRKKLDSEFHYRVFVKLDALRKTLSQQQAAASQPAG